MESLPQEVREYLARSDVNPFRQWLRSLKDSRARARIRVRLNRLRLGSFGDCRPIGEGLQELRIPVGPGYRVYFSRVTHVVVLLLCGGDKRTQDADIKTAKRYWRDYKERAL